MSMRTPNAIWPGLTSVIGCQYTCSHGISPGTAVLRFNPGAGIPASFGNLLITDSVGSVLLRGCRLRSVEPTINAQGGTELVAMIEDRRWRWRDRGQISGWYNQLDKHAKLIPWSIRSPAELAQLCFFAMGESNVAVNLPPGLTRAVGAQFFARNPPWLGVIPVTGTNPPINWDAENPSRALQQVADMFGKRVVYDPITDSVSLTVPGVGPALPSGSLARQAPTITPAESADGAAIIGAPTRFQARFMIEAVGEEWDGSYRPIDTLSYTPTNKTPIEMIYEIRLGGVAQIGKSWKISLATKADDPEIADANDGEETPVIAASTNATSNGQTLSSIASGLATSVNASELFKPVLASASASGDKLTIRGKAGKRFFISASTDPTGAITVQNLSKDQPPKGWSFSPPPSFPNVTPVDGRLTRAEARELASKCIWRYFRIVLCDPAQPKRPLKIPGYPGEIKRRQQIVLLPTSVEQIVPLPLDENLKDRNTDVRVTDFYNGYSHDRPSVVYGSVRRNASHRLRFQTTAENLNTDAGSRVFVDSQIDPEEQLVVFSDYVYRCAGPNDVGGGYQKPRLVLETACYVRDAETNQFAAQIQIEQFRPGNALMIQKHDDVQANVIGRYSETHQFLKTELLEADSIVRSSYYLAGLKAQIFPRIGETREYNGITPVAMSGAVEQVTYNVDVNNGSGTIASRNTEHEIYIPPAAARRRAEMLPPYQQLARAQRVGFDNKPIGGL